MIYVVSFSGGKDSVAAWCWARRNGVGPRRVVACDTQWERAGWREYVETVSRLLGESVTIVAGEGFAARTRRTGTFPSRVRRWCTDELKRKPFACELDRIREETGDEVTVIVGIRAEEGNGKGDKSDRATWPEREWDNDYDCEVWRPIMHYTVADVLQEHHTAGVPVNPLYLLGADRVGCWPCIYGGKQEIRLVADNDPARIAEIRNIEREIGQTMFAYEPPTVDGVRQSLRAMPIDEAVAWSRTSRGGKHLTLFAPPSGCMRWGMCEPVKR